MTSEMESRVDELFKKLKLAKHSKNALYRKYMAAGLKFIDTYLQKIPHTNVFLTGSFVTGKLKDESDLDFDIIHSDTKKTVVQTHLIDSVKVEYATFSYKMIEARLDDPNDEYRYLLARAVSNWKMVVGKEFPESLVEKAKKISSAL